MEFSKTQKKIIKNISDKKVIDLNSFYTVFIKNIQEENIASDIIGLTSEKPDFPDFCSIANTTGIVLDDSQTEMVVEFIDVWKKLESAGLIYTYENKISPFLQKHVCFIPVSNQENKFVGKFNNPAFHLTKDFMNKVIVIKEDLKVFITKRYKVVENSAGNNKRITVPAKVRALLQKEINSKCPFCVSEDVDHFEVHHIDENRSNNEYSNLIMVCPLCHSKINKQDITQGQVKAVKNKLANKIVTEKSKPSKSKNIKIKGSVKHSIVANTITAEQIIYKGKSKPKPIPHPDSIEANLTMKNYLKHLIDRYQEFIKDDLYKGERRFAQIWRAVKNEFGTDAYKIPQNKFFDVVAYLQKRIEGTRIGRINKSRGQKLFSTFEEYQEKYT